MNVDRLNMKFIALAVALTGALSAGCSKQPDAKKDSVTEEATAPAAGSSGIGAVNRARSTADKASEQTYKGDEAGK